MRFGGLGGGIRGAGDYRFGKEVALYSVSLVQAACRAKIWPVRMFMWGKTLRGCQVGTSSPQEGSELAETRSSNGTLEAS